MEKTASEQLSPEKVEVKTEEEKLREKVKNDFTGLALDRDDDNH